MCRTLNYLEGAFRCPLVTPLDEVAEPLDRIYDRGKNARAQNENLFNVLWSLALGGSESDRVQLKLSHVFLLKSCRHRPAQGTGGL